MKTSKFSGKGPFSFGIETAFERGSHCAMGDRLEGSALKLASKLSDEKVANRKNTKVC